MFIKGKGGSFTHIIFAGWFVTKESRFRHWICVIYTALTGLLSWNTFCFSTWCFFFCARIIFFCALWFWKVDWIPSPSSRRETSRSFGRQPIWLKLRRLSVSVWYPEPLIHLESARQERETQWCPSDITHTGSSLLDAASLFRMY